MHRPQNPFSIISLLIVTVLITLLIFTTDDSRANTVIDAPQESDAVEYLNQPTLAPQEFQQPRNTATFTRTPTPINVGNYVWDDLDKDGRQDAGEPGIAGINVQLWNANKTQLYDQTTTNASGSYSLTAPLPGSYRVRVLLPGPLDKFTDKDLAAGNDQLDSDIYPDGTDAGFTHVYTFASNLISITTIDAGIIIYRPPTPTRTPTPINLGNFVWNDYNINGVQDSGEDGLKGITVQLWNDAKTYMYSQTQTNASGVYSLIAPIPGNYRIRVLPPAGAGFTWKDQGADTQDSDINPGGVNAGFTDTISIASNVISITSLDAGLVSVPATPTSTLTLTPSNTALQPSDTPSPTNTEPAAEETLGRPVSIDTLAIFSKKLTTFTLVDTLQDTPPSTSFIIYLSSAPKKGKFIMGDWNGDGQKTPGLFKQDTLWYTNQIGATATWNTVQIGDYGKITVVAGRFDPTFNNDCFGVVQMKDVPAGHNFALRYTCELGASNPPGGIKTQWIDISLKGDGKYQFVAGDWNGDGLDSIAVRRDKKIKWGNVAPAGGAAVFPATQKFKTPESSYGNIISGDWNGDEIDTFGIFFKGNSTFYYRDDLNKQKLTPAVQHLGITIDKATASSWQKTDAIPMIAPVQDAPAPVLDLPVLSILPTPEQ